MLEQRPEQLHVGVGAPRARIAGAALDGEDRALRGRAAIVARADREADLEAALLRRARGTSAPRSCRNGSSGSISAVLGTHRRYVPTPPATVAGSWAGASRQSSVAVAGTQRDRGERRPRARARLISGCLGRAGPTRRFPSPPRSVERLLLALAHLVAPEAEEAAGLVGVRDALGDREDEAAEGVDLVRGRLALEVAIGVGDRRKPLLVQLLLGARTPSGRTPAATRRSPRAAPGPMSAWRASR